MNSVKCPLAIIAKAIEITNIGCRKAYIAERHNVKETIKLFDIIRSDALLFRFDLTTPSADFNTFLTELSSHHVKMFTKVDRLERLLEFVLSQFNWKQLL